jgi:hypothetical protein
MAGENLPSIGEILMWPDKTLMYLTLAHDT